jgi:hypothetical protein
MMRIHCDPEQPMIDLNDPEPIEILVNHAEGKIWINVGAVCMFRAQDVESVEVKEIWHESGGKNGGRKERTNTSPPSR